jgi:hypothetical protein
MTFKEKT